MAIREIAAPYLANTEFFRSLLDFFLKATAL
jgi:hypothetical protein